MDIGTNSVSIPYLYLFFFFASGFSQVLEVNTVDGTRNLYDSDAHISLFPTSIGAHGIASVPRVVAGYQSNETRRVDR